MPLFGSFRGSGYFYYYEYVVEPLLRQAGVLNLLRTEAARGIPKIAKPPGVALLLKSRV